MTPSELKRRARRLESLVETKIVREHGMIPMFVRAGDYQLPRAEDDVGTKMIDGDSLTAWLAACREGRWRGCWWDGG